MKLDPRGAIWPLLPPNMRALVFAGGGHGELARHYRALYPATVLHAVVADESQAGAARAWCDVLHVAVLDGAGKDFYSRLRQADAWVLDDSFATLADPRYVLGQLRAFMPADACVVAGVPNAQHWEFQAMCQAGMMPAQAGHRFTRAGLAQLLKDCGFEVTAFAGVPAEPPNAAILAAHQKLVRALGADQRQAMRDAMASRILFKARPQ
jgi:hypothetical protein